MDDFIESPRKIKNWLMRMTIVGLLIIVLLALPLAGEDRSSGSRTLKVWHWSLVALALSNGFDAASSVGARETNPVLGAGTFGLRAAGIKSSLIISSLVWQYWIVRRHPSAARSVSFANLAVSAGIAGVAFNNLRVRGESETDVVTGATQFTAVGSMQRQLQRK